MVLACGCGRIAFDVQIDADVTDGPVTAACEAQWLAGPTFSPPQELATLNTANTDFAPWLDYDDRTLYFASDRDGEFDIWLATRPSAAEPFGIEVPHPDFSSARREYQLSYSRDGLEMISNFDRDGTLDLFHSTRASRSEPFRPPQLLGDVSSPIGDEYNPLLSYDDLRLYFAAINRPDNLGLYDLWVAERPARDQPFGSPRLLLELDTTSDEGSPAVIATERVIVFAKRVSQTDLDLYYATRASRDVPFDPPQPVPMLNSSTTDFTPYLRADGCELFWSRTSMTSDDL